MLEESMDPNYHVLYPTEAERFLSGDAGMFRLAHYTSADAAVSIAQNSEVWLRNARAMNDFEELNFGLSQVAGYFGRNKVPSEFVESLDENWNGIWEEIVTWFDGWHSDLLDNTYILSLSEHPSEEDNLGRLSMWRAYGQPAPVALIVNPKAIFDTDTGSNVWSYPVVYLAEDQFRAYFDKIVANWMKNLDLFKGLPRKDVLGIWGARLQAFVLSHKHPGFREEREWRLVYRPKFQGSDRVSSRVEVIRGLPQQVYSLKLEDRTADGFANSNIGNILERIIIGPIDEQEQLRRALIAVLEEAGVVEPASKIFCSGIPLR